MKSQVNHKLLFIIYLLIFAANGYWGYWWFNLVLGFVAGYLFFEKPGRAFYVHFSIIFLFWLTLSIFKDRQVDGAVSQFLSSLANNIPPFSFYIITAVIGGLVTGWSAALGSQLRKITPTRKS